MQKIKAFLFGFVALLAMSAGAQAANSGDISLYLDTTGNTTGGCTVNTPQGTVTGADLLLQIKLDYAAGKITSVTSSTCTGGAFGAATPIDGAWQLSDQVTHSLVHGQIPLSALPSVPRGVIAAATMNGNFINLLGGTGGPTNFIPLKSSGDPAAVPVNNPWALLLLAAALLVAGALAYRRKTGLPLAVLAAGIFAAGLTAPLNADAQTDPTTGAGSVQGVSGTITTAGGQQVLDLQIELGKDPVPARDLPYIAGYFDFLCAELTGEIISSDNDANHNGVRDGVERCLSSIIPDDTNYQATLKVAAAYQRILTKPTGEIQPPPANRQEALALFKPIACAEMGEPWKTYKGSNRGYIINMTFNTTGRKQKFNEFRYVLGVVLGSEVYPCN